MQWSRVSVSLYIIDIIHILRTTLRHQANQQYIFRWANFMCWVVCLRSQGWDVGTTTSRICQGKIIRSDRHLLTWHCLLKTTNKQIFVKNNVNINAAFYGRICYGLLYLDAWKGVAVMWPALYVTNENERIMWNTTFSAWSREPSNKFSYLYSAKPWGS